MSFANLLQTNGGGRPTTDRTPCNGLSRDRDSVTWGLLSHFDGALGSLRPLVPGLSGVEGVEGISV